MSKRPMNVGKKAQVAAALAFALNPEDDEHQRRSLTSVKDGGTLTKWANVAEFTITTLQQGIKDSKNVGDSSLQKKLEEALAGFQELRDHYDNLTFLRNALAKKKGYDFPSAVRACEEQLKQDRRRFAETVEQSRNVSQGAAPAGVPSVAGVQAVAGDGASLKKQVETLELKTAELKFQNYKQMAELELQQKKNAVELEVRQKELKVQQKENMVETQRQLNKNEVAISENKVAISENKVAISEVKLGLTKVAATADRADSKADEALERIADLEDTVKKMLLSNPVSQRG